MKQIYQLKLCVIIVFLCSVSMSSRAQLVPGDIAFTGYHASQNAPQFDAFSFVLLKSMAAGTVIHFTENAWGNNSAFRTGENTVTFTLGASRSAGTQILIEGPPNGTAVATLAGGGSAGTCSGAMLSLSVSGDAVIAYQSATVGVAPFTFISAILMNVMVGGAEPAVTNATSWDNLPSTTQTTNSSFKPTTLTTGVNAIWIGTQNVAASEKNNARFNCALAIAGGADLMTVAGIRAACNNQAFWDSELAVSGSTPTWPLPPSCAFMSSPLPITLLSFESKNLLSSIQLQWKISDQVNFDHFELERQSDNGSFQTLARIEEMPGSGVITYQYSDVTALQSSATIFYYRLKMVDDDGRFRFSPILSVKNTRQSTLEITSLQNPISGPVQLTVASRNNVKATLQLTDLSGRKIVSRELPLKSGETVVQMPSNFPAGVYILTISTTEGQRKTSTLIKP